MLEGATVYLRALEAEDLPIVAAWRNQEEIRRSFFNKSLIAFSGQKKWYDRLLDDRSKQFFAVVSKETAKPIGLVSLVDIDYVNQRAELGTTIVGDRSMWGKGIATEMIGVGLQYAFTDLGLHRLYGFAIGSNIGSIRSLRKTASNGRESCASIISQAEAS